MNSILLFFNSFLIYSYISPISTIEEASKDRRIAKFFGVGVVRFENGLCSGGEGLQGTCYTRRQCFDVGGTRTGSCASGIGVCCVIRNCCGDITSYNNTYFVSPNFPRTFNGGSTCTLTIRKCNSDICQVRLDFMALSLAQPNTNGSCVNDALTITGGASIVPIICGENSGQHVYVDFNGDSDIQLDISTSGDPSFERSWNIKVAQIGCDCPTRAPTGCLMYNTALSGTVTSFNYGTTGTALGTRQLSNENYGVCVAMQPGFCSIQWNQSPGDPYSFTVSNNSQPLIGNLTAGTPAASITGSNCTTDFIVIPSPIYTNGSSVNSDRFCGNGFPTVTSNSKPFILTVVTNGDDVGDAGNRGFSLMYTQQRCTGSMFG